MKQKGKILVTGASGFIGSHMVSEMQRRKVDYVCLARQTTGLSPEIPKDRIALWNPNESVQALKAILESYKCTGIIHLASKYLAAHTPDDLDDLVGSNILFGTKILEAFAATGRPAWFLNIGTFWQHFANKTFAPVNLYSATKQAFEDMAQFYVQNSAIDFVTLKICDTFGANDTRRKLFSLWKEAMATGQTLEMSAGNQYMDISPVENVVDAILYSASHLSDNSGILKNGKDYFLRSNSPMTVRALAEYVQKTTGNLLPIEWGKRPYRRTEIFDPIIYGDPLPGWIAPFALGDKIREYFQDTRSL